MTELIVVVGNSEGTVAHVKRVISGQTWEKIFVVGTQENIARFSGEEHIPVPIDNSQPISSVRDQIFSRLQGNIAGLEVGLNIVSGTGKEHMAVLSALLKVGVGFRLIALTPEGITEV